MRHPRVCRWLRFSAVWMSILALIIGVTVTGVSVMPHVLAAGEEYEAPTLFYNDTAWAMDDYYPSLGYIIGAMEDFWIPLSFYEEIEGIRVRRGAAKNNTVFVIQDTETEKYLSFNLNDSTYAQTERATLILIHTRLFSKERYLPMRDMCSYFGWTFEISDDHRSVRICDGGEQKTFDELLAVYAPPAETETETQPETPPVTEPGTEPDDNPDIYRAHTVYLTFEDIDSTVTPLLLDCLQTYDVRAAFFATGEQLSQHPETVLRILAEGHALGLHGMTADETELQDTDGLLASFDAENELLYALVRRKTRLIRMPEGSRSGKLYLTDRQKDALADAGYVLWDWNISAMDHAPGYTAEAVLAKIDAALKTSYYPVIRMHCTETASIVLPQLLQRLTDAAVAVGAITEATAPVVFP